MKPLYYKTNNGKDFTCPFCGSRLFLQNISYIYIDENGKPANVIFTNGGCELNLICPKCKINMTNQLGERMINVDENNNIIKEYELISSETIFKNKNIAIENYKNIDYNGFFKKEEGDK